VPFRVAILTLGCKTNHADADALLALVDFAFAAVHNGNMDCRDNATLRAIYDWTHEIAWARLQAWIEAGHDAEFLKRLGTDRIDLYMLHRPDYLADPAEIAAAFSALKQQGKVLHFGVSNFRPSQLSMLRGACPMPLVVNQVDAAHASSPEETYGSES